jgi:hypothetical protein
MSLYTIFAGDGSIADKTKAKIAEDITHIHAEVLKVPNRFVRVVFLSYASGCLSTIKLRSLLGGRWTGSNLMRSNSYSNSLQQTGMNPTDAQRLGREPARPIPIPPRDVSI